MAKLANVTRRAKLDELEAAALKRLGEIIRKGSDKDALVASDLVLRRTMPEPKASASSEVAKAAMIGASAGAAHLAAIAQRAQARLAAPAIDTPATVVLDPERTPLVDVSTLPKGAKG